MIKLIALGTILVATPLGIAGLQDPATDAEDGTFTAESPRDALARELAALRHEYRDRLEALVREHRALTERLAVAEQRAADAVARAEAAEARLAECTGDVEELLDVLEEVDDDHNCAPSRALMTRFQWHAEHGDEERAASALERIVERTGDRPSRLNRLAWDLLTDDDFEGRYDALALAIAERMEGRSDEHAHLDTLALALFRNGRIDEAVEKQREAVRRSCRDDDYVKRLRQFEAAQQERRKGGRVIN